MKAKISGIFFDETKKMDLKTAPKSNDVEPIMKALVPGLAYFVTANMTLESLLVAARESHHPIISYHF